MGRRRDFVPVVVYTEGLEPLTVLGVPLRYSVWPPQAPWIKFWLPEKAPIRFVDDGTAVIDSPPAELGIRIECMRTAGGGFVPLFVVDRGDEEKALALRAALLPGQEKDFCRRG